MRVPCNKKRGLSIFAICLVSCCVALTGCIEEVVDDLSTSNGDPQISVLDQQLESITTDCPKQLNDYTTLKWVKKKGETRLEFRYQVSEVGRENLDFGKNLEIRAEILERMQASELIESIVALDLSVDHLFRDEDNKTLFSTSVTPQDLEKADEIIAQAKRKFEAEAIAEQNRQAALEAAEQAKSLDEQKSLVPQKITTVSNSKDLWLPSEAASSTRSKVNPAGLRENPYGVQPNPTQQTNPYFQ